LGSLLELPLRMDAWSVSILRLRAAWIAASWSLPIPPPPLLRLPPTTRGSGTPRIDAELGVVGRPAPAEPVVMKLTLSSNELVRMNRSATLSSGLGPSPNDPSRTCSWAIRAESEGDGPYFDESDFPRVVENPSEREVGTGGGLEGNPAELGDETSAGVLFFRDSKPILDLGGS
jgi:hypothetical protein